MCVLLHIFHFYFLFSNSSILRDLVFLFLGWYPFHYDDTLLDYIVFNIFSPHSWFFLWHRISPIPNCCFKYIYYGSPSYDAWLPAVKVKYFLVFLHPQFFPPFRSHQVLFALSFILILGMFLYHLSLIARGFYHTIPLNWVPPLKLNS